MIGTQISICSYSVCNIIVESYLQSITSKPGRCMTCQFGSTKRLISMHAETWVPDPKNSNQSVSVSLSVRLRLVTNNGILNDESRSYLHQYIQSLATQMFDQQTSKSVYYIICNNLDLVWILFAFY